MAWLPLRSDRTNQYSFRIGIRQFDNYSKSCQRHNGQHEAGRMVAAQSLGNKA